MSKTKTKSTRKPLTEVYTPADFSNIKTIWDMMDRFDKSEREASALWFLRYCQHVGTWGPHSESEFRAWCLEKGEDFWCNGLFDGNWGIDKKGGNLIVGEGFVTRLIKE